MRRKPRSSPRLARWFGDHRHQHGRPRYRHPPRWQLGKSKSRPWRTPTEEQIAQIKAEWQKRHQQVIEAGGLHVIASERHESRRIDNQLRGRAGRQGDPGSSRFYLSLEDNLMRIFASDRVKNFMKALGMQSGEAIEHRMVTNAIEGLAQGRRAQLRHPQATAGIR